MRLATRLFALAVLGTALSCGIAAAQQPAPSAVSAPAPSPGQMGKDVMWIATPERLVELMLDTAKVTSADTVIDLGSGDGVLVFAAAKRGAKAIGIEYNPKLVEFSKQTAAAQGSTATFIQGDIFETDFTHATVLTMFLLDELNEKLRPTILNMKPGTRIVSNTFHMGDWEPDERIIPGGTCTYYCRAYFWVVPAKVEGKWQTPQGELTLTQSFQTLSGQLKGPTFERPVVGRLNGNDITLMIGGTTYTGRVEGEALALSANAGAITLRATK